MKPLSAISMLPVVAVILVLLHLTHGQTDIQEPAVIVAHSDDLTLNGPHTVNDTNIRLMCAAYGEPLPIITWSSPSEGVDNFTTISSDFVFVNSTTVRDENTTLSFIVSVLEVCEIASPNVTFGLNFICEASNGVMSGNPIGVSRIIFGQSTTTTQGPVGVTPPTPGGIPVDTPDPDVVFITSGVLVCVVIVVAIISFTIIMIVWINKRNSKSSRNVAVESVADHAYHIAAYEEPNSSSGGPRGEDNVYRRYNNELYEGNQPRPRIKNGSLYDCAAYGSTVPSEPSVTTPTDKYEYAYVKSDQAVQSNVINSTNTMSGHPQHQRSERDHQIEVHECAAYDGRGLAHVEEWLPTRADPTRITDHTYEQIS